MPYRIIVKYVKQMAQNVSVDNCNNVRGAGKCGTVINRPTAAKADAVRKVRKMIKLVNPPIRREIL